MFQSIPIEELTDVVYSLDTETIAINQSTVQRQNNSDIYDLTGRKLDKATESGIYIIDGRKVVM